MYTFVAGDDPLRLIHSGVAKVGRAVRGLSTTQLGWRLGPRKWCVHEIVGHLLDYEMANAWRLRRLLGEPGCRMEGWDQELWAAAFRYQRMPFARLLRGLREARAANLLLLDSVPRKAILGSWYEHEERGREDGERFLIMWAGHDLNHLEQIRGIRVTLARRSA